MDGEAAKKVGEAAKEGEEGPSPKKRRREVKNAVRGSGQYVYDEDGVRLVSQIVRQIHSILRVNLPRYLDCAASVSHVGHSHPRLLQVFVLLFFSASESVTHNMFSGL